MKVKCRSILLIGSQSLNNVSVRKTYDMTSVREHEFDLPIFRTWSFYFFLPLTVFYALAGVVALFIMPIGGGLMLYYRDDSQKLARPLFLVPFLGAAAFLTGFIGWKLAVGKMKEEMLVEAVAKERNLSPSAFEVMQDWDWEMFKSKLQ